MGLVNKKRKLKIVIVILALLLCVNIVALIALIIHKNRDNSTATVTVGKNTIISDEASSDTSDTSSSSAPASSTTASSSSKQNTSLYLHNRNADDNTAFKVGNMFPGDTETEYFCIGVSHTDTVELHFRADVRQGYEKLAEVLKLRISLPATETLLYDGTISGLPESLDTGLTESSSGQSELVYEITAYLDTSVGNEYQNKTLIADLHWWVDDINALGPHPQTGENNLIILFASVALISFMALLLLVKRRKKETVDDKQ